MDIRKLSDLPNWDDSEFDRSETEEGEGWKVNPSRQAGKALYEQWQQVMIMLTGALDSMTITDKEDGFPVSYWEDHRAMLLGDAHQVAVKIMSSEAANLYMLRMENATIIRKNAQYIKASLLTMMSEKVMDEIYGSLIRDEIDAFRILFREWVASFQKDEFEDEWGLFN